MPGRRTGIVPFFTIYLLLLAIQFPPWMFGGFIWAVFMTLVAGSHPVRALVGGANWGFVMWVICGNLLAALLAWRRTFTAPFGDEREFREALGKAAEKLRLKVLSEAAGEIVLGPKRALFRARFQETVVSIAGGAATITGPAITVSQLRKKLAAGGR